MKKRLLAILLCVLFCMSTALTVNAKTDANNGDWTKKTVVLKNTSEAELSVRVGDIDALNDEFCLDDGYNPFVARDQYAHAYPWMVDSADPTGTDRIYVGSAWKGESMDGYSDEYIWYKNGELAENAFGSGALKITMNYDTAGIRVKNALLQICVDDFQSVTWESNF
ncbi:MAG: hypothetical protein MJ175_12160, partial [Clostridia bacterium]|nr:hypothetical protein [Clostridia bacterium]